MASRPRRSTRLGLARVAGVAGVMAAVLAASGLAWADYSNRPASEANSFTAATLTSAQTPTSIHPTVTGAGAGDVTLSWSATEAHTVTFAVQRAPASSPTSWATVNGGGSGQSSSSLCTGSVPGTLSCSYLDNSTNSTAAPAYGQEYVYRVQASIGGWSATSGSDLSQSLAPTSGTETSLVVPTLQAVSASSATAVWAVGDMCTVLYSAGTGTWTKQTVSTSACPTGTTLYGVDADGGSPVIVGANGVTFRCSASCTTATPTWVAMSTSLLGSPTLYSVSAQNSTNIWAVGANCTVFFSNGITWSQLSVPTADCPTGTTLRAVNQNGGHPLVAGDNATLILCSGKTCGTAPTWNALSVSGLSGAPALLAVGVNGGTNWAGGASGAVATCTGGCGGGAATWAAQSSGTANSLSGLAAPGANLVFAVGAGGTIVTCTVNCNKSGTAWSSVTSPTTAALNGVAAPTSSAIWAVGAAGTIVFSSGGNFSSQSSGLSATEASTYTLSSADLNALSAPDATLYTDQAPWPSGTIATACSSSIPSLVLQASPTVPSGSWTVGSAVATVVLQANATPGTGAGFALVVSADGGASWTSYTLTNPGTGGAAATTSVSVLPTISSTTALQSMRLCLVGTSGSGAALTTSVDLVHLDVN